MRILLVLIVAASLAACTFGLPRVHRITVQQGNVITQEMIDKLKPGMTRSQVRFVLGTPLVTDSFHPNRWDYYYYLRRSEEKTGETRRLTLIFKNDTLVTVQGDKPDKTGNEPPQG